MTVCVFPTSMANSMLAPIGGSSRGATPAGPPRCRVIRLGRSPGTLLSCPPKAGASKLVVKAPLSRRSHLDVQSDVEDRRAVGDGAHGDAVDAGGRVRRDGVERDAAADL